jgi:hypothetical protein
MVEANDLTADLSWWTKITYLPTMIPTAAKTPARTRETLSTGPPAMLTMTNPVAAPISQARMPMS